MKTITTLALIVTLVGASALFFSQGTRSENADLTLPPEEKITDTFTANLSAVAKPAQEVLSTPTLTIPKKKREPTVVDLAVQSNDLCKLLELTSIPIDVGLEALLDGINASPEIREMYTPGEGTFSASLDRLPAKLEHKSSKVLLAYRLVQLAYPFLPDEKASWEKARNILLELEKEEPGNGAYPFARIQAEKLLGYSQQDLVKTAKQIERSSYFELHFDSITREVFEAVHATAALHYVYQWVWDTAPFSLRTETIRGLVGKDGFESTNAIGHLMVQKALRSTRGYQAREWSNTQYAAGWELIDERERPLDLGSLSQEREGEVSTYINVSEAKWTDEEGRIVCDPTKYEDRLRDLRNKI